MKITKVLIYQLDIPVPGGPFHFSMGRYVDVVDHTFVSIETDEGVTGIGEFAPVTNLYLEQYANGARAAISEIAPALIGMDPRKTNLIYAVMDNTLRGHPYAKSAIDMACWDIFGKWAGLAVCDLLGGRSGKGAPNFMSLTRKSPNELPDEMARFRTSGVHHFQLKVGNAPDLDIERIRVAASNIEPGETLVADANRGWRPDEAMRVINAVSEMDLYIEQPCSTYEECKAVKPFCPHPMILDECILDGETLVRAYNDGVINAVDLKVARIGGISKVRKWRDVCAELGIPVKVTCSWGSDVVNAACAHLNHSTPEGYKFAGCDFRLIAETRICTNDSVSIVDNRYVAAPKGSGLGLDIDWNVLGEPIMTFS